MKSLPQTTTTTDETWKKEYNTADQRDGQLHHARTCRNLFSQIATCLYIFWIKIECNNYKTAYIYLYIETTMHERYRLRWVSTYVTALLISTCSVLQKCTCKTKQQYIYLSTTYSTCKLCDLTEKVMYSIKRQGCH